MMLPDGELAAMWKAARGLRRTAAQYDDMAANWPSEAARYGAEAKRLRDDADWYLATLRRATRGNGRATWAH
jgi:hypothetical protein